MKNKKIRELIEELETLRSKADQRSRMIIENGMEIPEAHKTKAEGAANAYFYCILRLKMLLKKKNQDFMQIL